ncbi:MAG: hypothetical protein JF616_16585 [Fibrobacteres bacterium]|nr:hypothetical protein [Fibrobacterota bacterium]
MAKPSRDTGLTLMQSNPPRELLLEKMRGKLATTRSKAQVATEHNREVRKRTTASWTLRAIALIALCALNYFIIGNHDMIAAKLHKPAIPTLPSPAESATPDQQALYYVYALFDYPKLNERYGVSGFYAVNQADAKRRIEALLPQVSDRALGEISRYMPIAFKTVNSEISK